ncbi:sensor histidine kinase, partial [Trichloromonas sp.]|uniref:sensor histidine kinase n=1 Tax=Trichloromonas sp. TaxID=3069249 RepID=UPI003D8177B9
MSWNPPVPDPGPAPVADVAESLFSARRELRELTQAKPMLAADMEAAAAAPAPAAAPGGWLPWFWENRFYLLGWIESPAGLQRYGVEIETMALLSRLSGTLPAVPPAGEVYALVDGNGEIFHQSGAGTITAETASVVSLPVGSALPHWQVAVYAPQGPLGQAEGDSFLILSTLVVGAFVAAILFGGSLLLWQAWRNLTDARRKTSFVANVSHELKTPLTTIRMYAELLGEGRILDPAKRGRYLKVIVDESQRLSRLVNNVLDFGRLEQGRKTYSLAEFDLGETLHGVLDSQAMRIEGAGMSLVRKIPGELCVVHADRDAFEQAVLNLIDNALKYAARSPELEVELLRDGKGCRIRVLDRGPGVPPAQRQRIFEKFHRVDDSLTTHQPGSGLGLSIARQLLRDMGGDLTCSERPGGGCCFEILLPCDGKGAG